MMQEKEYTLCGGTFLTLLIKAGKSQILSENNANKYIKLNQKNLFLELIRTAFPGYTPPDDSMKTFTSDYKNCKYNHSVGLNFYDDKDGIAKFDDAIKGNYTEPLERMKNFSNTYIDEKNKKEWLVYAIIEIIKYDKSIKENELFYIVSGDNPVNKEQLINMKEINLQPFLLSIWHFILTHREDNRIGKATINSWYDYSNRGAYGYKFISDIGINHSKEIKVNILSLDNNNYTESTDNISNSKDTSKKHSKLSENNDISLLQHSKEMFLFNKKFIKYFDNICSKYSKMKTLLYTDMPRDFYSFYVCNNIDIKANTKNNQLKKDTIHDATAEILKDCSNFILISGTGGIGKSMMMRHLLLDSIKRFKEIKKLPVFVPLKDYDNSYSNLYDYIYDKVRNLEDRIENKEFSDLLLDGSCILLLDGLDEIKSDYRKEFENNLDTFADKYVNNMFIMSSRPTGSFVSLHRFTVLNLSPFTKTQALELIDKLEFRPDEPKIKESFYRELKNNLFITRKEFSENPLLLTIMLMTYEQFADIPSKMHIFYREAYSVLAQKHDASKGAYKRVMKTGLSADKFADYFSEFCARSYRDEKFEFTRLLFDRYFNDLNEHKKSHDNVSASDFLADLTENLCLMYYEGEKYHFIHRSFQEYFCALYFSKQKDKTLKYIGEFFENKPFRNNTDKTFSMLYDMIPEKIEEYVLEPFLHSLYIECNAGKGYLTFLQHMYPVLYIDEILGYFMPIGEKISVIYELILSIHDIGFKLTHIKAYNRDMFSKIESCNSIEDFKVMETHFTAYTIYIKSILAEPKKYKDIIEILNSDDFPIKKEYLAVINYTKNLINGKKITRCNDLFDLFQ